ncbi:MAG: hypothetical protein AAGF95_32520 [Chloroflexota bacterium]
MEGVKIRASDQGNFEDFEDLKIVADQSQHYRVGAVPCDIPSQDDTAVANRRYLLLSTNSVPLCSLGSCQGGLPPRHPQPRRGALGTRKDAWGAADMGLYMPRL